MSEEDWLDPAAHSIGLRLAGDAIEELDRYGKRITDDTLFILMNSHDEPPPFTLPAHRDDVEWELILDTRYAVGKPDHPVMVPGGSVYEMEARSLALFRQRSTGRSQMAENFLDPIYPPNL
jgi:glycogen operon protein